jgi:hypothetical protein
MSKPALPANTRFARLPQARPYKWHLALSILVGVALGSSGALAFRESNIAKTKHNLSVNGPGDVKIYPPTGPGNFGTTAIPKQTEICIFCHTPHGGTPGVEPAWNRKLSNAVYTTYTSSSLSALDILGRNASGVPLTQPGQPLPGLSQPGGSSKLCLSCHDGTLAIGNVNVMWGMGTANSVWQMPMLNTAGADSYTGLGGGMPYGGYGAISGVSGVTTGFTRVLGLGKGANNTVSVNGQNQLLLDLTNDHPISVSYTHELAVRNGELRDVTSGNIVDPTLNQQSVAVGVYTQGTIIGFGKRFSNSGYKPMAPLENTGLAYSAGSGQIQCATCHDPHLNETDPTVGNQKFLRMNRFQEIVPQPEFNYLSDIGCLACHDVNHNGAINGTGTNSGTWAFSSHANQLVAQQTYQDDAANMREFPTAAGNGASSNLPVWKASCLNCHDTHTVQGARWLLREGTDSLTNPKTGGNSAIEETCYQCHSNSQTITPAIQDIKTDFSLFTHMPITLQDQVEAVSLATGVAPPTQEVHSIGGIFNDGGTYNNCSYVYLSSSTNKCAPDFLEARTLLGVGNLANRHAECTDCHNPHRTVPFQSFEGHVGNLAVAPGTNADSTPELGTHQHSTASGVGVEPHSNVASGSLRGTFGVEPAYSSASFNILPSGYTAKRGDPDPGNPLFTATTSPLYPGNCAGANKPGCDGKLWVTREYQICLKCHSDYGYTDSNTWTSPNGYTDLPYLGPGGGGNGLTPSAAVGYFPANGLTHYTNQAREFQAPGPYSPSNHQGEPVTTTDSGAGSNYSANNHRSWHPVMDQTGRAVTAQNTFTIPWGNAIGSQTMYCSDCHGSDVNSTTSVIPDGGARGHPVNANWGPHGSAWPFILKGEWDYTSGGNSTDLCFKCHDFSSYASGSGNKTGFGILPFTSACPSTPGVCAVPGPTNYPNGVDGHQFHYTKMGKMRCDWCHTAVPHGFKNKGLLVNLNDLGPEAGQTGNYEVPASSVGYAAPPYYINSMNKVLTFAPSGQWVAADCGSKSTSSGGPPSGGGTAISGLNWMLGLSGNETCKTAP